MEKQENISNIEEIIAELNPSCRIGEYRDRIFDVFEPIIKFLTEQYDSELIKIELTQRESIILTRDFLEPSIRRCVKGGIYHTELKNLYNKILNARSKWKDSKSKEV